MHERGSDLQNINTTSHYFNPKIQLSDMSFPTTAFQLKVCKVFLQTLAQLRCGIQPMVWLQHEGANP